MKSETRKVHEWIFVILCIVLVVGTVCAYLSMGRKSVPITLAAGQTATLSAFRVLPAPARLLMQEREPNRRDRVRDRSKDSPSSAPILFRLKTCKDSIELQAQPETQPGLQMGGVRALTLATESNSPLRRWPNAAAYPRLPAGNCELALTVLSVDEQLVGKTVQVVLFPPISWKTTESGYAAIWLFAFGWPFFTVLVLLYLLVFLGLLAWDKYKLRARDAAVS